MGRALVFHAQTVQRARVSGHADRKLKLPLYGHREMNDSDLFKLLISNLQIKAPAQTKTKCLFLASGLFLFPHHMIYR